MDGEHLKFRERRGGLRKNKSRIIDLQQSWGDEDGPGKGPRPPLLVAADFLSPDG